MLTHTFSSLTLGCLLTFAVAAPINRDANARRDINNFAAPLDRRVVIEERDAAQDYFSERRMTHDKREYDPNYLNFKRSLTNVKRILKLITADETPDDGDTERGCTIGCPQKEKRTMASLDDTAGPEKRYTSGCQQEEEKRTTTEPDKRTIETPEKERRTIASPDDAYAEKRCSGGCPEGEENQTLAAPDDGEAKKRCMAGCGEKEKRTIAESEKHTTERLDKERRTVASPDDDESENRCSTGCGEKEKREPMFHGGEFVNESEEPHEIEDPTAVEYAKTTKSKWVRRGVLVPEKRNPEEKVEDNDDANMVEYVRGTMARRATAGPEKRKLEDEADEIEDVTAIEYGKRTFPISTMNTDRRSIIASEKESTDENVGPVDDATAIEYGLRGKY